MLKSSPQRPPRDQSQKRSWSLARCHPPTPHRTEFGLDALVSGGDVIRAIRELSYKGGNTRTGAAILHVADHVFLPQLARPGIPKVTSHPTDRASRGDPRLGV